MARIGVGTARRAEAAKEVVISFACEATANANDLVYQDPSNDKRVLVNTSNTLLNQTIGVIKEKPTATTANVLILGIIGGFTGLTRSGRVFLQTDGTAGQTLTTTGYVHNLGVAVSETEILFIPNNNRVLRS